MSLGYLRSWLHRSTSSRRQRPAVRKSNMGVEQLEQRQLLSTTPTTLLLDFGTAKSPVAPGYTQVTPVKYSATRGFGWQSTSGLTAINRNATDPLTRDVHRGRNNTFLASVPNGTYQVTAVLGNLSGPLDRVNIVAEGRTVASNLSAAAGRTVAPTFQVNVTDSRLNLQFVDRGGRNPYFSLAALNIRAVDAPPAAPTADAGADHFAHEGDAVSFSGRAAGGSGLSYLWNFGDGTTAAGTLTPTHTYRDSGTYTVSLTITDAGGQTATDTNVVTLNNVAPKVTLGAPLRTTVGTLVPFAPTVTDSGAADVEAGFGYLWDFGDGGTSSEANPLHAFAAPGTYTVSVSVFDKDGSFGTATTSVQVDGITPALSVNAGPDRSGNEGAAVSFNGTASGGAGGLSYLWDFGDGNSASGTLTPSHAYRDNGSYTVTLTVTDAAGASRSDTAVVTVANVAPTPLPGGPYAALAGAPIAFAGSTTDAGQADTQVGFTYQWDFGDGTTSSQRNPSKTYAAAGTFAVRLTVTDKDGSSATSQTTAAISAAPVPLSVNAGPDRSGNEGSLVSFSGTSSGGAGGLSHLWDFGDGNSASDTLTPSHAYRDNGSYTVTLTVTDTAGQSRTDTAVVTVANLAPTSLLGGPYAGSVGAPVAFTGNATDVSQVDTQAGFSYRWDFGDGSTSNQRNPSKTYAAAGTFTVQLTVTDKDGASGTAQTTAAISAAPEPGSLPAVPGLLAGLDFRQGLTSLLPGGPAAQIQGTVPLDAEGAHIAGNGIGVAIANKITFALPRQVSPYLYGSFLIRFKLDEPPPGEGTVPRQIGIGSAVGPQTTYPAFSVALGDSVAADGSRTLRALGSGSLAVDAIDGIPIILPTYARGSSSVTAEQWHTLCVSWDPYAVRIYVDGALEQEFTKVLSQITVDDYFQTVEPETPVYVEVGAVSWPSLVNDVPFAGAISHVLLSGEAWDTTQVAAAHAWAQVA